MKNNKGITLIALVITIIVMLILVSVTITIALNGGLFEYARKASVDTNTRIKEEQTLANGIFGGKRIEDWVTGGESLLPGATIPAKEADESNGINGVYVRMSTTPPTAYYSKITDTEKAIINGLFVSCGFEGVTFDMLTYGGNKVPDGPIQTKDCYLYGDYAYGYNFAQDLPGWAAQIWDSTKSKTSYGELLNSINGEDLTHLFGTFYNCTNLTKAPRIPNGVTDMSETFNGCTSLTTVPNIPNNVTNMSGTFRGCTSLTTVPNIPNSVTDMSYTFWYCTALKGTITIDANPTEYSNCLWGVPNTVTLAGTSTKLSEIAATRGQ